MRLSAREADPPEFPGASASYRVRCRCLEFCLRFTLHCWSAGVSCVCVCAARDVRNEVSTASVSVVQGASWSACAQLVFAWERPSMPRSVLCAVAHCAMACSAAARAGVTSSRLWLGAALLERVSARAFSSRPESPRAEAHETAALHSTFLGNIAPARAPRENVESRRK